MAFDFAPYSDDEIREMASIPDAEPEFVQACQEELDRRAASDEKAPAEEPAPKPSKKSAGGLRAELVKLEKRRAELKRTPKEQLDPEEYAEVKTRIAEIKAELGE